MLIKYENLFIPYDIGLFFDGKNTCLLRKYKYVSYVLQVGAFIIYNLYRYSTSHSSEYRFF